MKPDMESLIERYGNLEQGVRLQMEKQCRPFCSVCTAVCCRHYFCIETLESVFLRQAAKRFSPGVAYHPSNGWLSASGCTLLAGRPPVCYEFLCRRISKTFDGTPDRRHALLVLSMVMTYVGRRAIRGRHVVEATRSGDLNRIHSGRFMDRLRIAEDALDAAVNVFEGRPSATGNRALFQILS